MSVVDIVGTILALLIIVAGVVAAFRLRAEHRRDIARLDAGYEAQLSLHRRAILWPEDGCHYCGSTDTPINWAHYCAYCAELYTYKRVEHDPKLAPLRMTLISG